MQLVLWRHAEAEDGHGKDDMARVLTKKGHSQAQRMAKWLKPRLEGDWRILVSPSKRTLQTVEPLGRDFAVEESIRPDVPGQNVLRAAGWPSNDRNVLIVGHQPTLGEAASIIFLGQEGEVGMRKGAIWWFETRGGGDRMNAVLRAVLPPELADD
jgi:phosphohistidine phosphatase